VFCGRCCIQWY